MPNANQHRCGHRFRRYHSDGRTTCEDCGREFDADTRPVPPQPFRLTITVPPGGRTVGLYNRRHKRFDAIVEPGETRELVIPDEDGVLLCEPD